MKKITRSIRAAPIPVKSDAIPSHKVFPIIPEAVGEKIFRKEDKEITISDAPATTLNWVGGIFNPNMVKLAIIPIRAIKTAPQPKRPVITSFAKLNRIASGKKTERRERKENKSKVRPEIVMRVFFLSFILKGDEYLFL